MAQQKRFQNPWWIVLGSTVALVVGNGPVAIYTFGVFLKPVSGEFGWDRRESTCARSGRQMSASV
jgi:hypothetical protein